MITSKVVYRNEQRILFNVYDKLNLENKIKYQIGLESEHFLTKS